jgi:hypothetical protein
MPPLRDKRFAEHRAVYRGTEYLLREVDTDTFDECVKKATSTTFRDDGSEDELIDQKILVRLLLERSLVKPKMSLSDFGKQGMRLISQLERDVRELHFGVEPEEAAKASAAEDDDEGNVVAA